jgi:hypothetical protein
VDVPVGKFASCRYEALRVTAGAPGREAGLDAPIFACHLSEEGRDRACAGWLAVIGVEHLGIRMAVATGRLPVAALAPKPGWPALYEDYEAMAEANAYVDPLPTSHDVASSTNGETRGQSPTGGGLGRENASSRRTEGVRNDD